MADREPKVLSCASCRQRKIKCDKVQPVCTQCSRLSLQCVYPSRKPTRRVPRPRQSELLERISRLETIVGQADPEKLQELDQLTGATSGGAAASRSKSRQVSYATTAAGQEKENTPASNSASETAGRETASRYMSDEFWGNLCEEVEGIKQALDQPSEGEDEEDDPSQDSPETNQTDFQFLGEPSGFMFGNPNFQEREQPRHPPAEIILRLWNIYLLNVDPLIKILHRPTLGKEIETFALSPQNQLHPSKNALLFAIYFAAVSTLSNKESVRQLGETQDVLIRRYRTGCEKALAVADYLNSSELASLQAATLYVTLLRVSSVGRSSWVLTSMIVRIGQAMNLHRDGDGRRFRPFEAEMRRRLWYFICVLDVRGAEDRGSDSILTSTSYNTIRPTNIDDDAFGPDSTSLTPKATHAENVICMCTARCSVFGYIIHPHGRSTDGESTVHTEDELITHVRALENDFIHNADPTFLPSRYASEVARMVILKLWLIVQYPYSATPTVAPMRVSRETMLRTAVSVMDLQQRLTGEPFRERFAWWTNCYVQWHPLAVTLAELCIQTEGELVERAWRTVETVYPLWKETVADTSRGPLWRPIKKLYKKAKEARTGTMIKDLNLNEPPPSSWESQQQQQARPHTDQQPLPTDFDPSSFTFSSTIPSEVALSSFAGPLDASTGVFDANMDPSFLFEYPSTSGMDFTQAGDTGFGFAPWNEFLLDTQMDLSPDGSGDSYSG